MFEMKKIKIRILKSFDRVTRKGTPARKFTPDDQPLEIEVDKNGIPLDKFWRNRLKDSEIDNCIEIYKPKKVKKHDNE